MSQASFPRRCRLTRRREFLRVQGGGHRVHLPHFLVFVARRESTTEPAPVRLGITVTRKVGGAVVRNRIKRLVREVFRRRRSSMTVPVDIVWVAKRNANAVDYDDVSRGFDRLARQLGCATG